MINKYEKIADAVMDLAELIKDTNIISIRINYEIFDKQPSVQISCMESLNLDNVVVEIPLNEDYDQLETDIHGVKFFELVKKNKI